MDYTKDLHVGDKVRILQNRQLFEKEGPKWSRQVYEIAEDNITTFGLKGEDRIYKHYELRKVQKVETNPLVRVTEGFDVEQNLVRARQNLAGPRSSVQHRPSTRYQEHARIGFPNKRWSRGPKESQKEEIHALKKQLVGTEFLDEGIRWKIVNVKWNGKYQKIMVLYYDMDQYVEVPPPKDQEYIPIEVIREILRENNLDKSI